MKTFLADRLCALSSAKRAFCCTSEKKEFAEFSAEKIQIVKKILRLASQNFQTPQMCVSECCKIYFWTVLHCKIHVLQSFNSHFFAILVFSSQILVALLFPIFIVFFYNKIKTFVKIFLVGIHVGIQYFFFFFYLQQGICQLKPKTVNCEHICPALLTVDPWSHCSGVLQKLRFCQVESLIQSQTSSKEIMTMTKKMASVMVFPCGTVPLSTLC